MKWAPQPGDAPLPKQGLLPLVPAPFVPRSRASDPLPSHDAAAKVPEFGPEHRAVILQALIDQGPGTCWDLAGWTGIDHVAVARRMKELEAAQAVGRMGETRSGPREAWCTLWYSRVGGSARAS